MIVFNLSYLFLTQKLYYGCSESGINVIDACISSGNIEVSVPSVILTWQFHISFKKNGVLVKVISSNPRCSSDINDINSSGKDVK